MDPKVRLIGAALAVGVLAMAPAWAAAQVVAVKAGLIVPVSGPPVGNGTILIRGGKIAAVGKGLAIPRGARVIDARGKVVIPGLVAALTHLGDQADADPALTPQLRAVDAFDRWAKRRSLLEGGVTSAYIACGARRLAAGQGGVVKMDGGSKPATIVRSSVDVRVALGEAAKSPPALFRPPLLPTAEAPILPAQQQLGSVRPSQFAMLRQFLADARAARGVGNPKFAALRPVLAGERPLRVVAHTVGDIRAALAFAAQERVKLVLEGATEGYLTAGEIARHRVPVVAETSARIGRSMDADLTRRTSSGRASLANVAIMSRAGVRVALAPGDDDDLPDLLVLAAHQVQHGVSRDAALRMVTSDAAWSAGVGQKVGSLAPGMDADLLVLSGDPLDSRSRVELAIIGGATVYRRVSPAASGELVAIRAGRILTATQGEIANGVIVLRGTKIASVSRTGIVPAGARVIDASRSVVMPGMIDAHSHLGLHADWEPLTAPPTPATTGTATGKTRLLNAVLPGDPAFAEALNAGVTTVLLAPPTSGQVCGQAALLKTALCPKHALPCPDRIVKEIAAVCFDCQGGTPRMSKVWTLRETLQRAKDYLQRRARYLQDHLDWERDVREAETKKRTPPREPADVPEDEDLEPLAALFRKDAPALVHASRADEITNALTVFVDEFGLSTVAVDVGDADRVPDELRKRGVTAACGPEAIRRDMGVATNRPAVLARSGVWIAFQTSATSGVSMLRSNAAYAVRHGMDPADALKGLTIHPARALMVGDRLGSIEPGKDADLVVLTGDPLDLASRVQMVLVNGKVVSHGK